MVQPIIIAAGGTGGHLFPAEALAAELIRRGERVALMTDARSAAYDSPVFANAERFVLQGSGLSGHGVGQAMRGASALLKGTLEARRHIRNLSPSAIVGFGGYPSFPPIAAARLSVCCMSRGLLASEPRTESGPDRADHSWAQFPSRANERLRHRSRVQEYQVFQSPH